MFFRYNMNFHGLHIDYEGCLIRSSTCEVSHVFQNLQRSEHFSIKDFISLSINKRLQVTDNYMDF